METDPSFISLLLRYLSSKMSDGDDFPSEHTEVKLNPGENERMGGGGGGGGKKGSRDEEG